MNKFVRTKSHTGSKFSKTFLSTYIAVFLCGVRWRHKRASNLEPRFFGQFRTSLRKDSVANYASIWTLFTSCVKGLLVLCKALNSPYFCRWVAPQKWKIFGGNFQKCKKNRPQSCAKKISIVTIEIVINYTRVMGIPVAISCRYCIALEVMLLFLVVTSVELKHVSSCEV